MYQATLRATLLACAFGVSFSVFAQAPTAPAAKDAELIHLRYDVFDPMVAEPVVPEALRGNGDLWIVQFRGAPTQAGRDAVAGTGAEVCGYLPDNAYVVRMAETTADAVRALGSVRWVGGYEAAYRIDPTLLPALQADALAAARPYNVVVTDKRADKPALAANVAGIGGTVLDMHEGGLLMTVGLTGAQLLQAAKFDEVLWIDAWTESGDDVDNARIQGGANYVEAQAGYTGAGMNVHIYEGLFNHIAFSGGLTNVLSSGAGQSHGTNTAGIVFGDGTNNLQFRGFAPDTGKFFTTYTSVSTSRWNVVQALVNTHNVSHTTASWGGGRTRSYTSISADADDIIFDHDLPWTQSQSNAGTQDSRPEAWAKNIFSIGGVAHFNDSNPANDSWQAGGASTGPAADGRIKPTLCAYYDNIGTTSGTTGYTGTFGGTSGATPIVAGHNILAIQMFTDDSLSPGIGPFGNTLRNPGAPAATFIHENRPHFTTLKALQVASARQYPFTAASSDNRREHQGWGFPNLQTMWDLRAKTLVVDETDVLTQGASTRYDLNVAPNEPAFRAVLNYAEPAANPAAAITLINNLSLKVTSPTGAVYWGNNGLSAGNWSVVGGSADGINPIECVFVQNPTPGVWHVDVIATSIVQDSHVETPAMDADYGLVVTGGSAQPSTSAFFLKYGQGCPGSTFTVTPCAELNATGGALAGGTDPKEYAILVSNPIGAMQIQSVDVFTRSTGGTQTIQASIYTSITGVGPVATTTMNIGPTAGFYTATFATPVSVSGTFFIGMDISAQNVVIPSLTTGATGVIFTRTPGVGAWTFNTTATRPAYRVACTAGTVYDVPTLDNVGNPVIGSSYDITLSDALASAPAFILTGFSDSVFNATPLPYALPGAPGCEILAAPLATRLVFTNATGAASETFPVANSTGLIGLDMFHQWAVLDPANALGIVVSDAGKAHVGT